MEEEKPKKEKEPGFFQLSNPSRVTPPQGRFIALQAAQRYVPVSLMHHTTGASHRLPLGIVMLCDTMSAQPEDVTKGK